MERRPILPLVLDTPEAIIELVDQEKWYIFPQDLGSSEILIIDGFGCLTFTGKTCLLDPRVVRAFYSATDRLRKSDVIIPGPDPIYSPFEQKIAEIATKDTQIELKQVKPGDCVIVADADFQGLNPLGEAFFYIGEIRYYHANLLTPGGEFGFASVTTARFDHYNPTDQHISGVYPTKKDVSIKVFFDNHRPGRWGGSVHKISRESLDSINTEADAILASRLSRQKI